MPLEEKSPSDLLDHCQRETARYLRGNKQEQSNHCLEIVRRASSGDDESLSILLDDICTAVAKQACPSDLPYLVDDLAQDVCLAIWRKFRFVEPAQRFKPTTYAGFRKYLRLTIHSVVLDYYRAGESKAEQDVETVTLASDQSIGNTEHWGHCFDQQKLIDSLLNSLDNPLQREIVRQRYLDLRSPDEIVANLQPRHPDIDQKFVSRQLEYALRNLRRRVQFRSES